MHKQDVWHVGDMEPVPMQASAIVMLSGEDRRVNSCVQMLMASPAAAMASATTRHSVSIKKYKN